MDSKIKVLALIAIIVAAAFGTVVVLAMQTTPKTDSTGSVGQAIQPELPSVNATNSNGFMNGYMGFGGQGMGGGLLDMAAFTDLTVASEDTEKTSSMELQKDLDRLQISPAFTANVTSILNSSTDVQALVTKVIMLLQLDP